MATPALIAQLQRDAVKYTRVELTRLGREVEFIDKIDTTVDFMVGSVIDGLMTTIESAITAHTNIPEDNAIVRGLVTNAIYKAIDNVLVTGISDMVNRRPGEIFSRLTGLSSLGNLINSFSNRSGDRIRSSLKEVSRGAFDYAEDIAENTADVTDRLYNKMFNIVSLTMSQDPSMIGSLATASLQRFIEEGGTANDRLSRFDDLVQSVATNCAAIDPTYYTVDHYQKTRDAQGKLEAADSILVNVRSQLTYSDSFDEYRYGLARQNVEDAADILASNGNSANRIQEIMGALEELDSLLVGVEDSYGLVETHKSALEYFMQEFEGNYNTNGCLLGIMNNVQAEIRSVINSMEAVLLRGQISVMPEYERRWWMQLLAIVEDMNIVPNNVPTYFSADPDGYIADYNTNVGVPMQGITLPGIDLLSSQLGQLKYWVGRKLNYDIPVTQITNIASQILADNASREAAVTSAMGTAAGFFVSETDKSRQIQQLMDAIGMDRASELLKTGQWSEFFALRPGNATFLGQLEESVKSVLTDFTETEMATINGVAALNDVLLFVRNTKRSRDMLASTFTTFKDLAIEFKINREIPDVQQVAADLDRFMSEVS